MAKCVVSEVKSTRYRGVALDSSVELEGIDYVKDKLVLYPVPMSRGDIILRPAVEWSVPEFPKLVEKLTSEGLGGTPGVGKTLDWSWGYKIENTLLFGLYLGILRKEKMNRNQYQWFHPVQFIEERLKLDAKHLPK
ncbi:MAG: hypothetical protein U1E78_05340 [Gammaproteobacteria bacterium]